MKYIYFLIVISLFFISCSSKSQLVYIDDYTTKDNLKRTNYADILNYIEIGDILKIDVQTFIIEASVPYNVSKASPNSSPNIDLLRLEGYLVDENLMIDFPVLGKINVNQTSEKQLEKKIKNLLVDGGHLSNPLIKVRRVNSKFTILGEVRTPGTFSFFDKNINFFQALGYAGDLTIDGKRNNITMIREENGLRKIYNISLNESNILDQPYFTIKNNDVIIVNPNFRKTKSAGFIGSPASIASISSILLSITLLIINN